MGGIFHNKHNLTSLMLIVRIWLCAKILRPYSKKTCWVKFYISQFNLCWMTAINESMKTLNLPQETWHYGKKQPAAS